MVAWSPRPFARRIKGAAESSSMQFVLLLVCAFSHAAAHFSGFDAVISKTSGLGNMQRNNVGLRLRGGDDNTNPNGIWDAFRKMGSNAEEDGLPELKKRSPCQWGKASANRRSQSDVELFLVCEATAPGEELFAVGDRDDNPNDKIKILMTTTNETYPLWSGSAKLEPGKYKFKFGIESGLPEEREFREWEELQGMWGVEDYRMITVLPPPPAEAILLMSDIDGTLVGDEGATQRFRHDWHHQYREKGCKLIYNTGRPFSSALRLITEGKLDCPDALICSEGTEMFWFHTNNPEEVEADYEWREVLMNSWDYEKMRWLMGEVLEERKNQFTDALFLPDMSGQPMIVIKALEGKLRGGGLKYDCTISSGGGNHFLLIVPPGAGKGSAALHCSRRTGFPPERVMVAGDGENDVPLFEYTGKGFKGTMVGNVCQGLANWAGMKKRPCVYRSQSSHALGVLEGLQHHFESQPESQPEAAAAPVEGYVEGHAEA